MAEEGKRVESASSLRHVRHKTTEEDESSLVMDRCEIERSVDSVDVRDELQR